MTDTTMRCELPGDEIAALAREKAWRYRMSSDPHHSSTYTFNQQALVDFARAIEAAATERATPQWQDIATAPRDGTKVLLRGLWAGEVSDIAEMESMEIGFYCKGGDYPGFDWCATGGDMYRVWCKPTHWMPLPSPPTIRQGGGT